LRTECRQPIVSKNCFNSEAAQLKHKSEILERKLGDSLCVLDRFRFVFVVHDCDSLKDVIRIGPSRQPVVDAVLFNQFLRLEVRLYVDHVHVIEHQVAARFQCLGNILYHGEIFGWIFKISETREQIENAVKRVGPERLSHVLSMKVKVRTLILLRPADAFGR